jgi:RNA polymerase sigma-70 factor (ECF subfamily)
MFDPLARARRPSLVNLADEELMARAAAGDQDAFAVIFDRHGSAAYSLAYRMCAQHGPAEDVVQEAFVSLWRSAALFDERRGGVRTLVLSAVRHRAIDSFRTHAARQGRDVPDEGIAERLPALQTTDVEAGRREEARHVRDALATLPDEQRRVIELAYFGGFSHGQIAEQLGLPPGTVKGRMRLGLSKLRSALAGVAEPVR